MKFFAKETPFIERLRQSSYTMKSLPETIHIPASSSNEIETHKALTAATVDDIAFAQQGLNTALSLLLAEIEAMRRLHDMARQCGAKGADIALDVLQAHGEIR